MISAYRVLIIEHPVIVCEALCNFFQREAGCAADAVPDIGSAIGYLGVRPVDLIVLDYDLASHDAFAFLDRLSAMSFEGSVIALATAVTEAEIRRLHALGAAEVVLKNSGLGELAAAVRHALRGLGRAAGGELQLTERQAQVLKGIAEGRANKEIAASLGVSETSVKCTVQQIFTKTGVRSRTALLRFLLGRPAEEAFERHAVDLTPA